MLAALVAHDPSVVPPLDVAKPMGELLLEALVKRLWVQLLDRDKDGCVSSHEIDAFLDSFDTSGSSTSTVLSFKLILHKNAKSHKF